MRVMQFLSVIGATLLAILPVQAGFMSGSAGDARVAELRSTFNQNQVKLIEAGSTILTAHHLCGASHIDEKRMANILLALVKGSELPENIFMRQAVKIADLNVREIESDTAKVVSECDVMKKKYGPKED